MRFNDTEKEVIFLKAIKEMVDSMVNFEIFDLLGTDTHSQVSFKSRTHQKFFNIILVDFLSCSDVDFLSCSNKEVLEKKLTYLEALQSICLSPKFNMNNSINNLIISTKDFIDWLEQEVIVKKIWLSQIGLETNLSIKRIEFIKICGNISKHNFSRLSGVVKELIAIFKRNCIPLDTEKALLILGEFYEWFHANIFAYHSSAIAEFLNNIRWGIYEYLQPEFKKSIVFENDEHPRKYHFTFPGEVNNSFAQNCYWDLMNEIRSKPYMNKFQVISYLKMHY